MESINLHILVKLNTYRIKLLNDLRQMFGREPAYLLIIFDDTHGNYITNVFDDRTLATQLHTFANKLESADTPINPPKLN